MHRTRRAGYPGWMDVLSALRLRALPLLGMAVAVGSATADDTGDSADTGDASPTGSDVVEACFDRGAAAACPDGVTALPDLQAAWEAREAAEAGPYGTRCTLIEVTGAPTPVAGLCCYPVAASCTTAMGCGCGGRRLTVARRAVRGGRRAGGPWTLGETDLPLAARRWLAEWWAQIGAAEHASVRSFAHFTEDLAALGAPAELLAGARRAGRDEARHARVAFALASRYAGVALAPAPLPPTRRPRRRSLAGFAAATTRDAAVEEARSTVVLAQMAAEARDPLVRSTLEAILADEIRHVGLAWATLRWAAGVGGEPVRRAIRRSLAHPPEVVAWWPRHPDLAAHGCPGTAVLVAAIRRADRALVAPVSAALQE